jgi:hypothetical protein
MPIINTDNLLQPGIVLAQTQAQAQRTATGSNEFDSKIDQTNSADTPLYRGPLGTPVYADVTFKGGSYTDNAGKTQTFGDVKLVTVLLTVHQSKKIITTEIQGRDGTVKEYIGMGDYEVTISGMLTGKNSQYPTDEVLALKDVLKAPVAIEIVAKYLQNLDIFTVVVQDFDLPQEAGRYSTQAFSIRCISDTPIELQIV